jgi:AcrR family transcriptional regulator
VLRYFESREAVLLELLDRAEGRRLAELPPRLDAEVTADGVAEQLCRHIMLVSGAVATRPPLSERHRRL